MLQPTFDNALGCLEPRRKSIRTGFLPAFRNRSEATLLAFTLETEPAVAILTCYCDVAAECTLAPFRRPSTIGETLEGLGTRARSRAPVDLSSLRGGGRHQPHLPPFAARVQKGPITHRQSSSPVARSRQGLSRWLSDLHGGCQHEPEFLLKGYYSFFANVRICGELPRIQLSAR